MGRQFPAVGARPAAGTSSFLTECGSTRSVVPLLHRLGRSSSFRRHGHRRSPSDEPARPRTVRFRISALVLRPSRGTRAGKGAQKRLGTATGCSAATGDPRSARGTLIAQDPSKIIIISSAWPSALTLRRARPSSNSTRRSDLERRRDARRRQAIPEAREGARRRRRSEVSV
jgi:hypothetical protein